MMLLVTCPECGGDGVETCNNPDHGFFSWMPGETGRLGCPGCIRGNPKHYGHPCIQCDGLGLLPITEAADYIGIDFESFIWDRINDAPRDFDAFCEWSISQ